MMDYLWQYTLKKIAWVGRKKQIYVNKSNNTWNCRTFTNDISQFFSEFLRSTYNFFKNLSVDSRRFQKKCLAIDLLQQIK